MFLKFMLDLSVKPHKRVENSLEDSNPAGVQLLEGLSDTARVPIFQHFKG